MNAAFWRPTEEFPLRRVRNRRPGNSLIPLMKAVIDMPGQNNNRNLKLDLMIACSLFAAGVVVSVMSLAQIRAESRMELAQATQPLQGTPSNDQDKTPAEAKPGGERPTTPAPEPARPDPQTQGAAGAAKPALPPAPAEKVAPPIQQK
ncbi:hypothetical protein GCM10010987_29590 [Bradyrhizobium guangdongense]|uniref:Uncharacterized protein n=2 Tax=Bradyrhizobium guangdongense TaxID=1325090 RepID=A0AA87W3Q0_9BRAD|nr:hypothetical protein GCM10010987_29590 [Bradyrhizobium guangdongense]